MLTHTIYATRSVRRQLTSDIDIVYICAIFSNLISQSHGYWSLCCVLIWYDMIFRRGQLPRRGRRNTCCPYAGPGQQHGLVLRAQETVGSFSHFSNVVDVSSSRLSLLLCVCSGMFRWTVVMLCLHSFQDRGDATWWKEGKHLVNAFVAWTSDWLVRGRCCC